MLYTPHRFQEYTTDWIVKKPSAGVFLDLGMGKTVCTLTAVSYLMHDYFEVNKVLIIAPLRVARDTWSNEKDKWDHLNYLKISKIIGSKKERIKSLKERADIYIINRENLFWLVDYLKDDWDFDMVIIDELSSFKSSRAKRFKSLLMVRNSIKRIVGLSGTPAPNGLMDLWAQVYLLDKGLRLESSIYKYRRKYFDPIKKGNKVYSWRVKRGSEDIIFDSIKDICISMKATDYLSLPFKIVTTIKAQLPSYAKDYYESLENTMELEIADRLITSKNNLALCNKLLQLSNGAVYDDEGSIIEIHDAKLKALEEVLQSFRGEAVLIFYNFRHDLLRLCKYLSGREYRVLKSSKDIEDWNRGCVPIMLSHPASCGHGLNLQLGGSVIIWFGLNYSLELYQQANARLYRQGQRDYVLIYHIIGKDTIEEDIIKSLERKCLQQEELLCAIDARRKRKNSWRVG